MRAGQRPDLGSERTVSPRCSMCARHCIDGRGEVSFDGPATLVVGRQAFRQDLMKKAILMALMVLVLVSFSGCMGGPSMLTRRMDDWVNSQYVKEPWLSGNVVSGVVIMVWFQMMGVIDWVVNVYYFWKKDAWPIGKGTGTPFMHANPPGAPIRK